MPNLALLDVFNYSICAVDRYGDIVAVNAAWDRFACENGGDPSRLRGNYLRTLEQVTGEDAGDAQAVLAVLRDVLSGRRNHARHEYACHAPNQLRWFICDVLAYGDGGALLTHVDVTGLKLQEIESSRRACHDRLTGLPNRRALDERVPQMLDAHARSERPAAMIFLDLDGFKAVNDAYGHEVGDRLLVEAADRVRGTVRSVDFVARIGGDEVVVLLRNMRRDRARAVAARIERQLSRPFEIAGRTIRVGASWGLAMLPEDGLDLPTLLARADTRMYGVKADRRALGGSGARRTAEAQLRH